MPQEPLRFAAHPPRFPAGKQTGSPAPTKTWWSPLWRGLVVEPSAKHYKTMRTSVWLYLYLLSHADRRTGTLFRKMSTISAEMGINLYTIRKWLATLRRQGYVTTRSTGRATHIMIQKWKPLPAKRDGASGKSKGSLSHQEQAGRF
jgi:hypothetical protein